MPEFNFNTLMTEIQSPFLIDENDEKSINEMRADRLRKYLQ